MSIDEKQMSYRSLGFEACYLASCALHDSVPELNPEMDLEKLYRFCNFHSITSIVAMALEMWWKEHPADAEIMKQWRTSRDKAIRKNILLNAERERILGYLESIGCWYMPLKGSLLQFDYPKFGMRQMSDNDLLVDPEKTADIKKFMLESGYSCEQYLQGHHDEYTRKPVYNFEIHRSLFKPEEAPALADYYADIHSRCVKDEDNQFGFHLSRSDFYIYLMAHAYNHFQESGIGIRHLLDVYIFLGKYQLELDHAYVERELNRLGVLEFAHWCSRISRELFDHVRRCTHFSEDDMLLLDAFYSSGSHGTEEQLFRKSFEKFAGASGGSRFRYLLHRMFPSRKLLGVTYPVVKKHGWMVPLVWIYRLIRSVFTRPGRVLRETIKLMDNEGK